MTTRFGFEFVGYEGLETGSRETVTHVVRLNEIVFAFTGALNPGNKVFGDFLCAHGDGVRDVAFRVEDAKASHD
jgi:4-hydroxyphenylpyruvate dioxygenase